MMTCQWCGRQGYHSVHMGIVNNERLISICTDCSNLHITDDVRGYYNRPVRFEETGIERYFREAK